MKKLMTAVLIVLALQTVTATADESTDKVLIRRAMERVLIDGVRPKDAFREAVEAGYDTSNIELDRAFFQFAERTEAKGK